MFQDFFLFRNVLPIKFMITSSLIAVHLQNIHCRTLFGKDSMFKKDFIDFQLNYKKIQISEQEL